MPTTSPDNIYYPDASTSAAFETALAQLAGSVQDAFDGSRESQQLQTFDWADSTERTAQTGMTEGAIGYQRDTDVYYVYTGSGWADQSSTIFAHRQLDATNDSGRFIVQHGIGKITGNATPTLTETVTFPVAFASVPVVIVNGIGSRATGAFNPTMTDARPTVVGSGQIPSTTGFAAYLYNISGGNLSSSVDWYYSWIAIGVAA